MVRNITDFKFNRKPYMSFSEKIALKKMIENNEISFFRLSVCENEDCKNDVIKSKSFCSKKCMFGEEQIQEEEDE